MKHIHIFSPDKDRKIGWYGSVVFMVLAWVFLAGLWIGIVVWDWLHGYLFSLEWEAYCVLAVFLFVVILIPVQLVRYFREKRLR